MKHRLFMPLTLVLLLHLTSVVSTQTPTQSKAAAAFAQLKSLVGEWDSAETGAPNAKVTYELVSGGSVLMETRTPQNEPSMVTLFHLDGDRLLMTHYCSVGNQPRLQADLTTTANQTMAFQFLDVTNLKQPSAGHMRGLRYNFLDPNNVTQTWTYREAGKDIASTFKLKRIK